MKIDGTNVLIIAPHPDDETLGCGGFIQYLCSQGKEVSVLILTKGEKSCGGQSQEDVKEQRVKLATQASQLLGVNNLIWGDLNDGEIKDSNMSYFKDQLVTIAPDVVFVPHPFEGWNDHEFATKYTLEAIKQLGVDIKAYYYCVWFWFSMPYSRFSKINWKKARKYTMTSMEYRRKLEAIDSYITATTPKGQPYSGILPNEFIYANSWNKELFFEAE